MTAREKAVQSVIDSLKDHWRNQGTMCECDTALAYVESALIEAKREGMEKHKAIIEQLFDEACTKAQLAAIDGKRSDFDEGIIQGIRRVLRKLFFPIAAARLGEEK